jgi:hypothetical protein
MRAILLAHQKDLSSQPERSGVEGPAFCGQYRARQSRSPSTALRAGSPLSLAALASVGMKMFLIGLPGLAANSVNSDEDEVSKTTCHPDRSEAEWRDLLFAGSTGVVGALPTQVPLDCAQGRLPLSLAALASVGMTMFLIGCRDSRPIR